MTPEIMKTLNQDITSLTDRTRKATTGRAREDLVRLRTDLAGMSKRVQDLGPQITDPEHQGDLRAHTDALRKLETELDATMKTQMQDQNNQQPNSAFQQGTSQINEHVEGWVGNMGSGMRNFLRGFLANVGLGGYFDSYFSRFDVRRAMREVIPTQFLQESDSRDGEAVERLTKQWQAAVPENRRDTTTFENFYKARITALRDKHYRDAATGGPSFQPRYNITSLCEVQTNSPTQGPTNGTNNLPEARDVRRTLKAELEMKHTEAILLGYKNIDSRIPLPAAAVIPPGATQDQKQKIYRDKRTEIGNELCTFMENTANRTPLYMQIRQGRLEEYEPISWYGVWEYGRSDDVIKYGFKEQLLNDPIQAFTDLANINPSSVSGIGHNAVRTFNTLKAHLNSASVMQNVQHKTGMELRNVSEQVLTKEQNDAAVKLKAATDAQANKKAAADKEIAEKNTKTENQPG